MSRKTEQLPCFNAEASDGTPYTFYGINATLAMWLDESPFAAQVIRPALAEDEDAQGGGSTRRRWMDDLWEALGGTDGWQIAASERVALRLWRSRPQLGPFPCCQSLADLQFEGHFWKGYRDHVAHALRVFLMGVYFFEKCARLREQVMRDLPRDGGDGDTDRFLRFWLPTALAHDVGYCIENSQVDYTQAESSDALDVFARFAEFSDELWRFSNAALVWSVVPQCLPGPQGSDPKALQSSVIRAYDRVLAEFKASHRNLCFDSPKVTCLDDLIKPLTGDDPESNWDDLARDIDLAAVGSSRVLEGYFGHARTTRPDHPRFGGRRPPFADHGIAGAMLILGAHGAFAERAREFHCVDEKVFSEAGKHIDDPHTRRRFGMLRTVLPDPTAIRVAARAVAIHNLEPSLWVEFPPKRCQRRFGIPFGENLDCSMAFLLRLCDALQVWDRPFFRSLRSLEPGVSQKGYSLEAGDEGVAVCFRATAAGTVSPMAGLVTELTGYLRKDDVESILREGPSLVVRRRSPRHAPLGHRQRARVLSDRQRDFVATQFAVFATDKEAIEQTESGDVCNGREALLFSLAHECLVAATTSRRAQIRDEIDEVLDLLCSQPRASSVPETTELAVAKVRDPLLVSLKRLDALTQDPVLKAFIEGDTGGRLKYDGIRAMTLTCIEGAAKGSLTTRERKGVVRMYRRISDALKASQAEPPLERVRKGLLSVFATPGVGYSAASVQPASRPTQRQLAEATVRRLSEELDPLAGQQNT